MDADRSRTALHEFTEFMHTDIARIAAMLLFVGHETTMVPIDLGILLLIDHPANTAHSGPTRS